ncbi:MAG: transglutaminase-like domain-containing protein, partial [bacterium]
NFDYEPYYGSLKGSQQTLWEKAGNDFDLASLLIALYRSCNIPARYVYGTIEIPIEKAMNWVGVKDPYTAAQIFASGGIPSKAITSGGKIVAIRLEHCWIEVYIAYLPYSGAKDWDKGDKIWIPVDSSFKQYESPKDGTYTDTETGQTISIKNLDISDKVLFDNEGYLKGTSTIFPVFEYLNNTQDWLLSNTPPNTFYNIFSAKTIIPESAEVLPGLPNKPLSILNRYSEIPDNLRHKISFSGNISYTARTIELASKRITLSYKGASSSDEDTIKSYGNLYNTPAYLVELIPQLRINGETKASGNPIPMAEDEAISLTFIDPGRPSEIITKNIISGGYYAFGLLLSRIPGEAIETTSNRFSESYKTKPLYNSFGLLEDDIMGEALYFSSLNWLYQTEAGERIASSLLNVITQRQAEITSEIATERDWLWGMPSKLNLMGISVDVGRDTSIVNPIDNDQTKIKKFITITLYNGSVNEHLTLDIPMGTITGVSGVKAIQISNQQGISIYKIDKTNIGSILPILQQDADVKGAIQDSVSAGNEVIIPEREITYYGFQGTGYIIQDPVTGAGACMISGGAAGAESLITMGVFVDLFEIFIENTALVIQGEDISILPVLESIPYWYSSFMALGAIYFLGYNPIYMRIHTKETYLNEVAKSKYKILYHCGHGAKDGGLILDNELLIKTGYNGYVDASHINSIDTNHYKFVYIDSCYGASVAQAFKSTCQLSYTDWVFGVISIDFAQWFWLGMILGNLTVKESYEDAKSGFIPIFLPIKLYGNGDINLKTK